MNITINNSTVTIYQEEKTSSSTALSSSFQTTYAMWKDALRQIEKNGDKIREIVLSEMEAALAKSKPQA